MRIFVTVFMTLALLTAPAIKSFKLGEDFRKLAPKMKSGEDADGGDAEGEKEKTGREPLTRALDLLATYVRDVLAVSVTGASRASFINVDRREEIVSLAPSWTPERLERALGLILDIRQAVERNANSQLALEVLFTQMMA